MPNDQLAREVPLAPLTLLAAASGARSFAGVAGVAQARARERRPQLVQRFNQQVATAATALAAFELMADKAPNIPDRIAPAPLFGRVVAGAIVGGAVAELQSRDSRAYAIAGALIAFASAQLTFRMRAALAEQMPAFAAGLVEDAVVAAAVAAGTALLTPRQLRRGG